MHNKNQPAQASSKRQLLADVDHTTPAGPRTSPRKRMSLDGNLGGTPSQSDSSPAASDAPTSSQKKKKERKERKDRRTTSAPKRGEYRCGKCGFFPKKAKHSCIMEKQKRAPGGPSLAGPVEGNIDNGVHIKHIAPTDPMLSYLNVPHPHW